MRNSKESARKEFLELAQKEGYEVIEEYVNTATKIHMICPNNHDYFASPHNFKSGYRCSICSRKSAERGKKEFNELVNAEGYTRLTEYKNNILKVKLKCKEGHEWEVSPVEFKRGVRCAYCNMSIGEKEVSKILNQAGINYEIQKSFDGLIGVKGKKLKFDFYLPDFNLAIEVQGEQHVIEGKYFKESIQKHDILKKEYCKNHNVELIEINYYACKLGTSIAVARVREEVFKLLKKLEKHVEV